MLNNQNQEKNSTLKESAFANPTIAKMVNGGKKAQTQSFKSSAPMKKKTPLKLIIGGIILLLLVVGSGAALYLTQMSQDVRQQAKESLYDQLKDEPTSSGGPTSSGLPTGGDPTRDEDAGSGGTCQSGYTYVETLGCLSPQRLKDLNDQREAQGIPPIPSSDDSGTGGGVGVLPGGIYEPNSTPVSCGGGSGSYCNCAPNDICLPVGGSQGTTQENGQTCFTGVSKFQCKKSAVNETIVVGGLGDPCDIGQRTACSSDGCGSGQQRLCGGITGLASCTYTDRCLGEDPIRGNGEITEGQSCSGLKRVSGGEPSKGGFVGCSSTKNCFCEQNGVNTGSTYSSGKVVCYDDVHNDSCGAPGVGGTPPVTEEPPIDQPPVDQPSGGDDNDDDNPESSPNPSPKNYFCNSSCTANQQCQSNDSNLICSSEEGNRCRLATNPTSAQCQPAVGPMCLDIDLIDSQTNTPLTDDPAYGDTVRFVCAQVSGADHYIFRVIEPDGNIVNLDATGLTSTAYTISQDGRHFAQCQICTTSSDDSCHSYEGLN